MKSSTAASLLDSIDLRIAQINSFSKATSLEKSYLALYLAVFISGIYEETIETIINEKVGHLGQSYIANYVENGLKQRFRNPDIPNILSLLGTFDMTWKEAVKSLPSINKDALNNIVLYKNSLAHGTAINLTLGDVVQYYKDSRTVIETIDAMVL
jgi:hypothetical protein